MELKFYQNNYPEKIKKLYNDCTSNINEVLKIGEKILPLIRQRDKKDSLHDIRTQQILSLYKEMLERADGILILIKSNSMLNAKINLRSFIEIAFDIRVILKDKSDESAFNYMYFKYGDFILKLETYNKTTEEIQKEWDTLDKFASFYSPFHLEGSHRMNVKKHLKGWYNYKKKNRIQHKEEIERKYYNNLCMEVHGQNSIRDNILNEKGIFSLKVLRYPDNAGIVFFTIIKFFKEITYLILDQYVEDEKTRKEIEKKLNILFEKGNELDSIGYIAIKEHNIECLELN